jgi:hypothetical protein
MSNVELKHAESEQVCRFDDQEQADAFLAAVGDPKKWAAKTAAPVAAPAAAPEGAATEQPVEPTKPTTAKTTRAKK